MTDITYDNFKNNVLDPIDYMKKHPRSQSLSNKEIIDMWDKLIATKFPKNIERHRKLCDLIDNKLKQEFIKRGNYGGTKNG